MLDSKLVKYKQKLYLVKDVNLTIQKQKKKTENVCVSADFDKWVQHCLIYSNERFEKKLKCFYFRKRNLRLVGVFQDFFGENKCLAIFLLPNHTIYKFCRIYQVTMTNHTVSLYLQLTETQLY